MPDVDGITLTRLIRQTPGYLNTPIVMLTAMRDKGYLDEAYSAGATDYVSKPFDFADLKRRLQSVQKLTQEKYLHQERPLMEGELKGMGEKPKNLRLSDPFALPGVDAAIDYREFENYAFQVRRHRQLGLLAIAVKITRIDHFYAESTSDAFKSLVTDAAKVLQETLLQEGGVLSYRGNGVFHLHCNEETQKAAAYCPETTEHLVRDQASGKGANSAGTACRGSCSDRRLVQHKGP